MIDEAEVAPLVATGIRRPVGEYVVVSAVGLLALGAYLWQLSVPEQLSFYDSGVYLAAAVHLVSGVLPYRDFTFVQPPGLLYLLAPVAVLSRVVGTHDGLTVGRALTSVVTAANCSLTALLVRHHGRTAMFAAGSALAVIPVAFLVSSAVKLEPFCILFVLIAALVVVGRGEIAALSRRSAIIAGVAFGVAGLVKLWAFFPFVVIVAMVAWRARHRLAALVVAAGTTFVAGVSPFLILAPRSFIAQVFVEQLGRRANPADSGSWVWRLRALTGFENTFVAPSARTALVAVAVLAILVAVVFFRWRRTPDGDLVLLGCTLAVVAMLLVSPETYSYYDYFAEPFLLGLTVVVATSLGRELGRVVSPSAVSRRVRRFVSLALVSSLVVASGAMALYSTSFYSAYAYVYGYYGPWINPVTRVIPAGACTVYSEVAFGVYANRFVSSDPRCPTVVDSYGEWLGNGYQLVAPPKSFLREWRGYFERAQYVVFPQFWTKQVPWDASLRTWFSRHFRVAYARHGVVIFHHRRGGSGA